MIDIDLVHRNVPRRLKELHQWVNWKYVQRNGKPTKVPVDPKNGEAASSTDPSTWGTFEQACEAAQRSRGVAGVGFVFSKQDPYTGIDFDHCVDPQTGTLEPWAQEHLDRLASYAETSPSGAGVKTILIARKPGTRCKRAIEGGAVEIYDADRFFTITGQRLPGATADIEERQAELDAFYSLVFPNGSSPQQSRISNNGHVLLEDDEIVRIASQSRKSGDKFRSLWEGRWEGTYGSQSEADSALVCYLAFYSKSVGQLDRLFRRSGLMRAKWDEQHGARTYGQMTIEGALATVRGQYSPRRSVPSTPDPADSSIGVSRPAIIVTDLQLRDLTRCAIDALQKANAPPVFFVRSGSLVRVVGDEKQIATIELLNETRVRARLADVSDFYSVRRLRDSEIRTAIAPPKALTENILAQGQWPFPLLLGLVRTPIVRPDGTICLAPGYDPATMLFYAPDSGLEHLRIPDSPTKGEIQSCTRSLLDLIGEFPFVDQASKSNALSLLFSILLRPAIRGHIPLFIFDAPAQGTGKTLLVIVLVTIAVGGLSVEAVPSKQNEDEWRKKITSLLMASSPVVLLDNVPEDACLDSPALAAAITGAEWSDRILSKSLTIRVPSRAIWVATGNNFRVAGDLPRRCISVRLDAQKERPWERSGFRIADIEAHARENRGELLSAALTIVRGWFSAGCPRVTMRPFGSFDEWAGIIGSVLSFAEVPGFLDNLDETRSVQDEDSRQWATLFDAWWSRFGDRPVTVARLFSAMFAENAVDPVELPDAMLVSKDGGPGSLRRSLGRHLSRMTGRVFNDRKLCDAGENTHSKVRTWTLKPLFTGDSVELNPANPAGLRGQLNGNPAAGDVE
ncbi:MAG: hypothetical protein J5J06_09330 [Phycisphaerae bacterium]|nr:hypothetical protein [Phycisphaerae bacterium]